MNFDALDAKMRGFEESQDRCVPPEVYMVARLDGRGFTGLTKDRHAFQAPFDEKFRDMMTTTAAHVMVCGVRAIFGFTQSDEISVLLHRDCSAFSRKLRKLNSVLAGEASARFSLLLGDVGVFDCRICELPNSQTVVDYFRWRQEDAARNALNAHCYWKLRSEGLVVDQATQSIAGLSTSEKNELLFQRGVNFNDLPLWQKRGVGLSWEEYDKEGANPKTGEKTLAKRRRIAMMTELPRGEEYSEKLRQIVNDASRA